MNIVTLIEELVNGLIAAEDIFFQNPKDFYSLEKIGKVNNGGIFGSLSWKCTDQYE